MVHERLDLARWIAEFPIARLRDEAREFVLKRRRELPGEYPNDAAVERHVALMQPCGEIVTSPVHIAINEQLRREALGDATPANAVLTDIFVMAYGEPPRRDVTKIGGLPHWPHWPRSRPWPTNEIGEPMTFIGQISFLDSSDIVGELPAEILLIFDSGAGRNRLDGHDLHTEWAHAGDEPLVGAADIPRALEPPRPCYGVIHRTFDMPEVPSRFAPYRRSDHLAILQATKIGGLPPFTQLSAGDAGHYIATVGSVHPQRDCRYPFVNVPEPLTWGDGADHLMWGDVGNAYLWLEVGGTVCCTIDCY